MTKYENQRLCGGTFFTLLLQARKPRMGVREHYKGLSDGLSEPNTLIALIKVINRDYRVPTLSMLRTFKGNTSEFKSCKISSSAYLPFGETAEVSAFDDRVKTEYRRALAAMSGFVAGFIDAGTSTKKDERLVKALLELIDFDETIDDTQPFYINENGSTMTKSALRGASDICLQSFLLGIWHFVLVNRKDNTVGKTTYDLWCPPAERKFTGMLGCNVIRPIRVSNCAEIVEDDIGPDVSKTRSSDERSEQHAESETEETGEKSTKQVVNNPTVFNQYGNNNIQIGNVDTLTIKND